MRMATICGACGCRDIEYIGGGRCWCNECKAEKPSRDICLPDMYEARRAQVLATGNRWALENFTETH